MDENEKQEERVAEAAKKKKDEGEVAAPADDKTRIKELEKENRTLKRRLKRAEWLLDISKKGAELMEKMALGHQFETEDSE